MPKKSVNRHRLFYNKFKYRVYVKSTGSRFVKRYTLNTIQSMNWHCHVSEKEWEKLGKVIDLIDKYKNRDDVRTREEWNGCQIYTNDIAVVNSFTRIDKSFEVTEATTGPDNTLYFTKNPKFKYRTYLKSCRVSSSQADSIMSFYSTNQDSLHLSQGFKYFINKQSNGIKSAMLSNSYFVDYDDLGIESMMGLMFGECVRLRFKLEKRPE